MSEHTNSELISISQQHEKELLKVLGGSYIDDIKEALRMRLLGPRSFRPLEMIVKDMIHDARNFDSLWNQFENLGQVLSLEKFQLIEAAAKIATVNQCASLIQRYGKNPDISRPLIIILLDKVYETRMVSLLAEN